MSESIANSSYDATSAKRWLACYSDEQGLKACTSSEAQPDYFLEFCAGEDKDILGNSGGVKDYEGDTADGSCMTDVSISVSHSC